LDIKEIKYVIYLLIFLVSKINIVLNIELI